MLRFGEGLGQHLPTSALVCVAFNSPVDHTNYQLVGTPELVELSSGFF